MDNSVDPQVFQTWRQARLRAFLSLLEFTKTDLTNKTQWAEERDNAIGVLEWAMVNGLDEVKPSDCPDFIDLVNDMVSRMIEDQDISAKDQYSSANLQIELVQAAIRKNELEIKNYYEPEVQKRLQAIQDAQKELDELIRPAKEQWELKVQ